MYVVGDRMTNSQEIFIDVKKYTGGPALPVYTKSTEMQFVSSQKSEKDKRPKREPVVVIEPFPLPISAIMDCRVGEYVKLHYLVARFVKADNPSDPVAGDGEYISESRFKSPIYKVIYEVDFKTTGQATLVNVETGQEQLVYSSKLDIGVAKAYFGSYPTIPKGMLKFTAEYFVVNVYSKGQLARTWVRTELGDGFVERADQTTVKTVLFVWGLTDGGKKIKLNLKLIKKCY